MQRLLQSLPSSALRLTNFSLALAKPTLTYPFHLPSTTRFSSNTYLNRNELEPISSPVSSSDPLAAAKETWRLKSRDALDPMNAPRRPNNSYAGRSVQVHHSKGFLISLQRLDGILSRNRVRQELRLTERHEKKGAKRRRLQSQRWKNRFANEVREKVQLVNKIRMRGA